MLHILSSSSIRIIFLFAVFSAVVYGQNVKAPTWYSLDSKDGGFSIKFPQKPKFTSKPMAGGAMISNSYSLLIGNSYDFTVAFYDFPGIDEQSLKGEFDLIGKTYIDGVKQKVVSNDLITQHGCEGKEFIGKGSLRQASRLRIFVSGKRYYMVAFKTANDNAASQKISDYFFNSFDVLDGCKGGFAPIEAPSVKSKIEYVDGVADVSTGWRKISPVMEGFDVLVPDRTEIETSQITKPLQLTKKTYSSYDKSTSYVIFTFGEWPSDFITPKRQKVSLDIVERNLREELESETTKITFSRNLSVATFPGREFSISSDTHLGRAQIFITPKRTYMFINVGERKLYNPSLADRFFGSIRITVK